MPSTATPSGYCPRCGYRINPGRCPECGHIVEEPLIADPFAERERWRRIARRVLVAGTLIVVLSGGVAGSAITWWPLESLKRLDRVGGRIGMLACAALDYRRQRELDRVTQFQEKVNDQIAAHPDHPWAGTYNHVSLSIDGEYCETEVGCFGISMIVMGTTSAIADGIQLNPTWASEFNEKANPFGNTRRLVRVRWGERVYMVPPDSMKEFCDAAGAWIPPSWYRRESDEYRPLYGLPDVPEEYRAGLPNGIVTGRVLAVSEGELMETKREIDLFTRRYSLSVDLGLRDGVTEGAEMLNWGGEIYGDLLVTEVFNEHCIVQYETQSFDAKLHMKPEIGWRISFDPVGEVASRFRALIGKK